MKIIFLLLQADLSLLIPGTDTTWEEHIKFAHPVDNTKTKVSVLSTKVRIYVYKRAPCREQ